MGAPVRDEDGHVAIIPYVRSPRGPRHPGLFNPGAKTPMPADVLPS
jgi:hypothetical protein